MTNPAQWDVILHYMGNSGFLVKGKVKNTLSFLLSPSFFLEFRDGGKPSWTM